MANRMLFLFACNFIMNLAASGTLEADEKFQYLWTLFRGEALRQFDSLYAKVESTETLKVDYIIRGLAQYFHPVIRCQNIRMQWALEWETAQSHCRVVPYQDEKN